MFKVDQSIDATGYRKPCIIINVEGDEWEESIDRSEKLETIASHPELTPEEIVNRIKVAGVTGMGGAGFPTFIKLCPPPGAKAECVIINGVECEPYITADYRLMMEHADEILVGLNLLMKAAKVEKGYIGIEDNKPAAIKSSRKRQPAIHVSRLCLWLRNILREVRSSWLMPLSAVRFLLLQLSLSMLEQSFRT